MAPAILQNGTEPIHDGLQAEWARRGEVFDEQQRRISGSAEYPKNGS
ncbi:MAG: hypothetical protein WDO73_30430 [Ignavibacteriota bacterium]